jgi:hypothetical protein
LNDKKKKINTAHVVVSHDLWSYINKETTRFRIMRIQYAILHMMRRCLEFKSGNGDGGMFGGGGEPVSGESGGDGGGGDTKGGDEGLGFNSRVNVISKEKVFMAVFMCPSNCSVAATEYIAPFEYPTHVVPFMAVHVPA